MTDVKFVPGEGRVSDDGRFGPELPVDTFEKAFVSPGERHLDPTLISKSLLERMPNPTGWRILVMPYKGRSQSKGGIYIPDKTRDDFALATVTAYVLKVGPLAYGDTDKHGDSPWCKNGDWILIGRYAGSRFSIEGGEVRIINDDEVIGTIMDPDDIHTLS
jgi:co-chaperonin GroES (HSP10)